MKKIISTQISNRIQSIIAVGAALLVATSTTPVRAGATPDGRDFHRLDKLDKVWLAGNFAFKGYDVIVVSPLNVADITPKDEKEAARLKLLTRVYAEDMARGLEQHGGFQQGTSRESDVAAGQKKLVLDTRLLEFSRGSSAARWTVGFGAGVPYLRIRGIVHEGDPAKPLAIFELDEKGDWLGGGFNTNETLQNRASLELGKDLGRFIEKVRNGEKINYQKAKRD